MTATIVATAEPGATPPRVRLDITTNQTSIVPYRVSSEGIKTPVRTYDGGPLPVSAGTAVLYDPEAIIGVPYTYTADGSGVTNSGQVTVAGNTVWLVHPGVPSRSQPIKLISIGDRTRAANASTRYPLARRNPIIAHDGVRKAPTYELKVRTSTLTQLDGLEVLCADLATLLLNIPATNKWGHPSSYVHVGDLSDGRLISWGAHPYREWRLPCVTTDRPAGGTQADITYGYSKALYPTYAARKAAHATYGQAFDPK